MAALPRKRLALSTPVKEADMDLPPRRLWWPTMTIVLCSVSRGEELGRIWRRMGKNSESGRMVRKISSRK
jgi:hypothetical protein